MPWSEIIKCNQFPNVILIDGRFRVACFLASLLLAKPGTIILFDDYVNRPHYHVVEKHLSLSKAAGRMVEFVIKENLVKELILLDLMTYSTRPE